MSARRKAIGRKRKQPESFNEDIPSQPRSKKRKLSHSHNKRTTKSTDDKSQSASPKISNSKSNSNHHHTSSNPYKNITIPTISSNKPTPKPTKPKPKTSRRRSQYTYPNEMDDTTDGDEEEDLSSPESSLEIHYSCIDRIPLKHNIIRSQPSTPIRKKNNDNNIKDKEPHSQSAKRSKIHKRYYNNKQTPTKTYNNNNNNNKYNNMNSNTNTSRLMNSINNAMSPINSIRNSSLSPPPPLCDRKQLGGLIDSQDSLGLSPIRMDSQMNIKPKMGYMNVEIQSHIIPVNATPLRATKYGGDNQQQVVNINNDNNNRNENRNSNRNNMRERMVNNGNNGELQRIQGNNEDEPPRKRKNDTKGIFGREDICYIILFAIIGFIVGFFVAAAGYNDNKLNKYPKTITNFLFFRSDINNNYNITDVCSCDITTNITSRSCSPCMDQYWKLKSECDSDENIHLKKERDVLKLEKKRIEMELRNNEDIDGCKLRLSDMENEKKECENKTIALKNEIQLSKNNVGKNCNEYEQEIGELKHELGECNVEWGSCEQLGRQKDKLDEKRVEEIKKQKKKFSLCNEQLKRYKEAAKKNKGK